MAQKIIFILTFSIGLFASSNLTASLAILPLHSEYSKTGVIRGGFVDLVQLMDERYVEGDIKINLYPFPRSIDNVVKGVADFHIPLIRIPHIPESTLPFNYVNEPITKVCFVLYTVKSGTVSDIVSVKTNKIETMRGHKDFFPFTVSETDSIEQGIARLINGRTTGFIMEQDAVDAFIKSNKIKIIHRLHYATWDSCMIVAKSEAGKKMNKLLSSILLDLKNNDEIHTILKTIHQPYTDWQPEEMKW